MEGKGFGRKAQASLSTRLRQGEKMLRPLFLPSKGKHTVLPPGLEKERKRTQEENMPVNSLLCY